MGVRAAAFASLTPFQSWWSPGTYYLPLMPEDHDAASLLASLRRRRAEVDAWLDGPVKKATLTAIDRAIAELVREEGAAEAPEGDVAGRIPRTRQGA
jgi:hypothetical protein